MDISTSRCCAVASNGCWRHGDAPMDLARRSGGARPRAGDPRERGMASLEYDVPIRAATTFRIASVSKPIHLRRDPAASGRGQAVDRG